MSDHINKAKQGHVDLTNEASMVLVLLIDWCESQC